MLKSLVVITFLLDTLHEVFICHTIYMYLIVDFANHPKLGMIEWSILAEIVPSTLVAFLVQSFFAYRAWILSKRNLYLTAFVAALILGELVVSTVYFAKSWSIHVFSNSFEIKNLSQSMNAVGAVGDICITVYLIVLLHRSKSGMLRSNKVMNSLILFSLNTGLLTSICAFMSLIMIIVFPDTFIYITFFFSLSRLYTNSLLATLNARKKLQTSIDGSGISGSRDGETSLNLSGNRRVIPLGIQSHPPGVNGTQKPLHLIRDINIARQVDDQGVYEMQRRDEPKYESG